MMPLREGWKRLALERAAREAVCVDGPARFFWDIDARSGRHRLLVDAPPSTTVLREELVEKDEAQR